MPNDPFSPLQIRGQLPKFDRRQLSDGFLTDTVSFTPEQEITQKKAHLSPSILNQTAQVQVWMGNLGIEIKGGIVPNAEGLAHDLPAGFVGMSVVTCAHFAAATEGEPAIARHGYTRDPEKLLMISSAKTELSGDPADCTIGMMYFPFVGKDLILAF